MALCRAASRGVLDQCSSFHRPQVSSPRLPSHRLPQQHHFVLAEIQGRLSSRALSTKPSLFRQLHSRELNSRCHVSVKDENVEPQEKQDNSPNPKNDSNVTEIVASLGIFAFWGAWAAYSFLAAPNQTPTIDQYYLEKLVGLRADDGFVINTVVFSLWNLMGLLPLLYISLLIPASRTDRNSIPAWPFSALSVAFGAFALLPYFALWKSGDPVLPSEEERKKMSSRIFESKFTAAALLLGVSGLVLNAATAPAIDWLEFGQIIRQSRLFHITTSDFLVLILSAPFWVYNDMSYRNWEPRNSWGLGLLLLPLFGPFLYLVLRPGLLPAPSVSSVEKQ